ncbi:MAG: prolipoprotein diacylglyceryl transferase [Ignavibacteria bacterium]|nr:prolipoprotein diacylglyceryl transferase [Ignavibacteria bacterium]
MYPKLFQIGPIPVYSYGLMLGIAFLVGNWLFGKELKRKGYDENTGVIIVMMALLGGIVGAKLFYILEEWNFGTGLPLLTYFKPDIMFSSSGLTFFGGLVLSIILIIIYCRVKKLSILEIFDMMAPGTILGYGIARIGCHLAGDGDYGIAIAPDSFWAFIGMSYSNGTIPTAPGIIVHPTPIYEMIAAFFIFLYLWKNRTKYHVPGTLFYLYLILAGFERFLVEIIRTNHKVIFDLSQAQLIAILMIVVGIVMFMRNKGKEKNLRKLHT